MKCLYCHKKLGFFASKKRPFCSDLHEVAYHDEQAGLAMRRIMDPLFTAPIPKPELVPAEPEEEDPRPRLKKWPATANHPEKLLEAGDMEHPGNLEGELEEAFRTSPKLGTRPEAAGAPRASEIHSAEEPHPHLLESPRRPSREAPAELHGFVPQRRPDPLTPRTGPPPGVYRFQVMLPETPLPASAGLIPHELELPETVHFEAEEATEPAPVEAVEHAVEQEIERAPEQASERAPEQVVEQAVEAPAEPAAEVAVAELAEPEPVALEETPPQLESTRLGPALKPELAAVENAAAGQPAIRRLAPVEFDSSANPGPALLKPGDSSALQAPEPALKLGGMYTASQVEQAFQDDMDLAEDAAAGEDVAAGRAPALPRPEVGFNASSNPLPSLLKPGVPPAAQGSKSTAQLSEISRPVKIELPVIEDETAAPATLSPLAPVEFAAAASPLRALARPGGLATAEESKAALQLGEIYSASTPEMPPVEDAAALQVELAVPGAELTPLELHSPANPLHALLKSGDSAAAQEPKLRLKFGGILTGVPSNWTPVEDVLLGGVALAAPLPVGFGTPAPPSLPFAPTLVIDLPDAEEGAAAPIASLVANAVSPSPAAPPPAYTVHRNGALRSTPTPSVCRYPFADFGLAEPNWSKAAATDPAPRTWAPAEAGIRKVASIPVQLAAPELRLPEGQLPPTPSATRNPAPAKLQLPAQPHPSAYSRPEGAGLFLVTSKTRSEPLRGNSGAGLIGLPPLSNPAPLELLPAPAECFYRSPAPSAAQAALEFLTKGERRRNLRAGGIDLAPRNALIPSTETLPAHLLPPRAAVMSLELPARHCSARPAVQPGPVAPPERMPLTPSRLEWVALRRPAAREAQAGVLFAAVQPDSVTALVHPEKPPNAHQVQVPDMLARGGTWSAVLQPGVAARPLASIEVLSPVSPEPAFLEAPPVAADHSAVERNWGAGVLATGVTWLPDGRSAPVPLMGSIGIVMPATETAPRSERSPEFDQATSLQVEMLIPSAAPAMRITALAVASLAAVTQQIRRDLRNNRLRLSDAIHAEAPVHVPTFQAGRDLMLCDQRTEVRFLEATAPQSEVRRSAPPREGKLRFFLPNLAEGDLSAIHIMEATAARPGAWPLAARPLPPPMREQAVDLAFEVLHPQVAPGADPAVEPVTCLPAPEWPSLRPAPERLNAAKSIAAHDRTSIPELTAVPVIAKLQSSSGRAATPVEFHLQPDRRRRFRPGPLVAPTLGLQRPRVGSLIRIQEPRFGGPPVTDLPIGGIRVRWGGVEISAERARSGTPVPLRPEMQMPEVA